MPRTIPRPKAPVSKFTPTPLDPTIFTQLYDILLYDCFEGNYSATARALSISILSARKYEKAPPTNAWWSFVLLKTIKEVHQFLAQSSRSKYRLRARRVLSALSKTQFHEDAEYMLWNQNSASLAVRHLLSVMVKHKKIDVKDLRKAGISGGYSIRILRHAAQILQLERETVGYGEDKITYWVLPT